MKLFFEEVQEVRLSAHIYEANVFAKKTMMFIHRDLETIVFSPFGVCSLKELTLLKKKKNHQITKASSKSSWATPRSVSASDWHSEVVFPKIINPSISTSTSVFNTAFKSEIPSLASFVSGPASLQ